MRKKMVIIEKNDIVFVSLNTNTRRVNVYRVAWTLKTKDKDVIREFLIENFLPTVWSECSIKESRYSILNNTITYGHTYVQMMDIYFMSRTYKKLCDKIFSNFEFASSISSYFSFWMKYS